MTTGCDVYELGLYRVVAVGHLAYRECMRDRERQVVMSASTPSKRIHHNLMLGRNAILRNKADFTAQET